MWSLAVEEQFYLVFPIILLILFRRFGPYKTFWAVAALAVASFSAMEVFRHDDASGAFYLAHFRAWELLAGSLCAIGERNWSIQHTRASGMLAVGGLLLIIVSYALFGKDTPFPSWWAIMPIVGTALVLCFARAGNWAGTILAWQAFVAIGLISYSLYLWHQPVLAFARIAAMRPLTTVELLGLNVLATALAIITWHWVERPFRQAGSVDVRRAQITWLLRTAGALAMVVLLAIQSGGVRQRFDQPRLLAFEVSAVRAYETDHCKLPNEMTEPMECSIAGTDRNASRIAVIGDSHAAQLFPVLKKVAQQNNWNIDVYAKSSCPIVEAEIGLIKENRIYTECGIWRDKLWGKLASAPYDMVLIAHSNLGYVRYNGLYNLPSSQWRDGFEAAIQKLQKGTKDWAVIVDNPQFRSTDPVNCAARTILFDPTRSSRCDIPRNQAFALDANDAEQAVARKRGGVVFDFTDMYCANEICSPMPGGMLVMSDINHLSEQGALRLAPRLEIAIREVLSRSQATRIALAD